MTDFNLYNVDSYNSDCSGITRGRVLNGQLYAQRLQTIIYLPLSTDCFMKIFSCAIN